ncbi:MAG: hypothetical protein ACE5DI_05485 [Candidatus Micrarchaeia archaeon]
MRGLLPGLQSREKGVESSFMELESKKGGKVADINDFLGIRVITSKEELRHLYDVRRKVRSEVSAKADFVKTKDYVLGEEKPRNSIGGYRALHDRFVVPSKHFFWRMLDLRGVPLEIQFRTPRMHWEDETKFPHHKYKKLYELPKGLQEPVDRLVEEAQRLYQGYEINRLRRKLREERRK